MNVFVVGNARSGTTHITDRIRQQFDIKFAPETHFFTSILRETLLEKKVNSTSPTELASTLKQNRFLADFPFDVELFKHVFSTSTIQWPAGRCFYALCEALTSTDPSTPLGEKTPQHLLHWKLLSAQFPQSQFVFVIRDPRSVVSSRIRAKWKIQNAFTIASHWLLDWCVITTALENLGTRAMLCHFEHAITEVENANQSFSEFFSLNTRTETSALSNLIAPFEHWKKDKPIEPQQDRAFGWADLADRDINICEMICWNAMKELGYTTKNHKRPFVTPTLSESAELCRLANGELQHRLHARQLLTSSKY